MREILRLTWERMMIIATIVGDVEGRVIATLFYFTILVPFGLGSRLLSDPLHLRGNLQNVQWVERAPVENELDAARQQG